ncbi:MAG TPA: glycosyltransferase family 2 protein [Sphingobacteriaceae bacterium]|nr:glycosyltransferase family 2 protein [Sphingobacteriaceae bacterium]
MSIIIPVYNVNQFVERCVLSALNQTYKNIEVIVVDDCGTDDSIRIVRNIISDRKYTKISKIVSHENNRGLSAARNTGIAAASGEYVFFLDADDEITLNCIELLVNVANNYKCDFIISDYKIAGTNRLYPPLILDAGYIDSNDQILKSYFDRDWYMMAFNKLVNTSFLINNELFFKEGIVHEDELWSFMVACKANTLYVIKDKTYIYNIRPGSITQSPSIHNLQSRSEIIKSMQEFITKDKTLVDSKTIYNYFEELKSIYFFDILSSSTNNKFKYNFYITIRNSNYLKSAFPLREYDLNFARIIRNIHYVLSPFLGFIYYKRLLILKRKLKI